MTRFRSRMRSLVAVSTLTLLAVVANASVPIHAMDTLDGLVVDSGRPTLVDEGPRGTRVIRFDAGESPSAEDGEPFSFSLDLGHIDLGEYEVLKIQMKAARAANVLLAIDHFPEQGRQARWYILDGLRGPTGWRTFIVDLRLPEEIREASDASAPRLTLGGRVKETGRTIQGSDRSILVGPIRAARRAVEVEWDQRNFEIEEGRDLVYTYPIVVRNPLDVPVTAELQMVPFQVAYAAAEVTPSTIALPPGASETVRVRVRLPDAERFRPLYAERFELWASARGVADSDVTIVRSSDVIHLPVVVPLPESSLTYPLLPTPDELPRELLFFDPNLARRHATSFPPAELIAAARRDGIYNYDEQRDDPRFRRALISAAYLYRLTGESRFLEIARTLLAGLPEIWEEQALQYRGVEHPLISSGIMVRWGTAWHFTLGLGWRLAGTQRAPYYYGVSGNGAGGGMGSILYAFDMLVPELSDSERRSFIEGFVVPAGIRSRNHYIGDANQQATANAVALYAGLAARNWPLVAFATSSEHSIPSILEWTFADDGRHIRNNYQTYTLRALFFSTELLYGRGIDLYGPYLGRWEAAVTWDGRRPFDDRYFWAFVRSTRIRADRTLPAPANLEARPAPGGGVALRWLDPSDAEAGFVVERNDEANGEFAEVGRSSGTWPSFVDLCPQRGVRYFYRVRGIDYRSGTSAPSNTVSATCG